MKAKADSHGPTLTAFAPVAFSNSTLLILGSMPGAVSLQAQEYYAHPRNAFWYIMQALFGTRPAPESYDEKLALLQQAGVALWDVLAQCKRPGSLDADIDRQTAVCNNFADFLIRHPRINKIAFNGRAAEQLFRKNALPDLGIAETISLVSLPSTSPAMATLNKMQKADIWRERLLQDHEQQ